MTNKQISGPAAIIAVVALVIIVVAAGIWYVNRPNPALTADLKKETAARGGFYGRTPQK